MEEVSKGMGTSRDNPREESPMKTAAIIAILLAALWLYQYRPIPVDRSWWRDEPVAAWRVEHGDVTIICGPGWCKGVRKNGEVIRL